MTLRRVFPTAMGTAHPGGPRLRIHDDDGIWGHTMRVIRGFGQPGDSGLPAGESHEYATWDAAYVLGSLSPADRREFEAHLSGCPSCTQAVAELSGMPALLSKLDSETVTAINQGGHDEAPEMAPNLLPSLMFAVRRRRRRSRLMTWSSAAAAAVLLAIGAFVGVPSLTAIPRRLRPRRRAWRHCRWLRSERPRWHRRSRCPARTGAP